jgi:ribose transport system substrate-binding protein
MHTKPKIVFWSIVLILIAGLLASCGQPSTPAVTTTESAPSGEATQPPAPTEAPSQPTAGEAPDVVIGLSNGYFGTDWRTQDINVAEQVFQEMIDEGVIGPGSELKIQHAGADTNQQIQQVRNMINEGVDVLMVNANSATALNAVLEEAHNAGIPIISFDQAVTSPYAYNVTVDHYEWGKRYAEWLASALNGQGKIIMMDGLPGHPAAEARKKAAEDVFAQYPDIQILQEVYGEWDQSKAQAHMSDILAAEPEIDGVFVEDSMATGVVRAFETADRQLPTMTGEATKSYLTLWKEKLDAGDNFVTFAQANPPGISGSAMKVATRVARGCTLLEQPDSTFYYPIFRTVDNDNVDEVLQEMADKPDTYFLDEWLTDAQANELFSDCQGLGSD